MMSNEELQRHYNKDITTYPKDYNGIRLSKDTVAADETIECDTCSGRTCECSSYS